MATFEPQIELFAQQVESIRAQSEVDWFCLISDDCSSPHLFEQMRGVLGDDPRFVVSRSELRQGFYRNFERVLLMVPREVAYVALADQDDCWYPSKLKDLRFGLRSAQLIYSDAHVVDLDGQLLAETYWTERRNNHRNMTSLLLSNTVTGAASLFRRELLDFALPFPQTPGVSYHDHWLALIALALGEIAYIDEPLYDYVQHEGAVLGHVGKRSRPRDPSAAARWPAWRESYFSNYCRLSLFARVLLMRCAPRMPHRRRRALQRFLTREGSPVGPAWWAIRSLRGIVGMNETQGAERVLARGLLWRQLAARLLSTGGDAVSPDNRSDEPVGSHRNE